MATKPSQSSAPAKKPASDAKRPSQTTFRQGMAAMGALLAKVPTKPRRK